MCAHAVGDHVAVLLRPPCCRCARRRRPRATAADAADPPSPHSPRLQVYYVYGFFLLVFLILLTVTACVTVVGSYFLLNAENYHWQWAAFGAGASTSLYVFLYSVHYFFAKTKMTGFFQTSFYFGYTLMFCVGAPGRCGALAPSAHHWALPRQRPSCGPTTAGAAGRRARWCPPPLAAPCRNAGLSIMCGAVGYLSSAGFVKRIYRNIKCD